MPEPPKPTRMQRIIASALKRLTGLDTSNPLSNLRMPSTKSLYGDEAIDPEDLVFGVKREPTAHRITYMVATDVWDSWFKIENLDDEEDKSFNDAIQAELERIQAKKKLIILTAFERTFGWAILVLRYSDYGGDLSEPVTDATDISEIQPYSFLSIQNVEEDQKPTSERLGLPEYYDFRIGSGATISNVRVHYTRVIHAATRLFDHPWKGISALEPAYDDVMSSRYIRWSVAMSMIRYGGGFPDVELKGADIAKINAFIASNQFDNMNTKKYWVHNESQQLKLQGLGAAALNPSYYFQPSMEAISAGTGIPEAVLRGAQAGAITGSEINERAYFKMVSDVQTAWEAPLRDLINRIAKIKYADKIIPNYKIEWNAGFELDERTKTEIELLKAQTAEKLLTVMTIDEARAKVYDLEPLPNGEGASMKSATPPQLAPFTGQQTGGSPTGPPGFDQGIPTDIEQALTLQLSKIVEDCKAGHMNSEDGVLSARLVIEEHVQRMKQLSILNVSRQVGKAIITLSPERERQFLIMADRYTDSFKRILKDALKGNDSR